MALRIKFWGVRGSLPASPTPQQQRQRILKLISRALKIANQDSEKAFHFLESMSTDLIGGSGTATTCVEVNSPQTTIILDGGSGLRNFSEHALKNKKIYGQEFHIFLTHFHWDHLIGTPFFAPHFIPGFTINYYAVQPELEQMIRGKFKKPYFPVPFEALKAKINFHSLTPRQPFKIKDISVTPYLLDHPDPCWGFRVQNDKSIYAHCVDTEANRKSPAELDADLPLYQNASLMYFDAQYTLPELAEKANWGHSASQIGLDLAFREKIDRVLFGHHDPGASPKQIQNLVKETREYYNWKLKSAETNRHEIHPVKWRFAHEGMVVKI